MPSRLYTVVIKPVGNTELPEYLPAQFLLRVSQPSEHLAGYDTNIRGATFLDMHGGELNEFAAFTPQVRLLKRMGGNSEAEEIKSLLLTRLKSNYLIEPDNIHLEVILNK